MVIINVKVKTLDSRNHDFTIDEDMTVKDFKEHISEKVEIAADLQRLIYCGRVLNDEKPLKDYDVNGKCLHLVQRPPPSSVPPGSSTSDTASDSRRTRFRDAMPDFENLMMGSFSIPVTGNIGPPHTTTSLNPSSTLCGNRITVAKHMLQCADNIAAYLENPEHGLNNQNMDLLSQQTMESTVLEVGISAVTDVDLPQQDVQNIVQAFQGAVSAAFRQNGINNITVQHNEPVSVTSGSNTSGTTTSSSITIEFPPNIIGDGTSASPTGSSEQTQPQQQTPPPQPQQQQPQQQQQQANVTSGSSSTAPTVTTTTASGRRQQTTSTQTLGEVVGQMQSVQRRLDPFIQQYYEILQNDPPFADDAARENAQRTFDRVSEALHYMSHAQHAISDLMLDLNLSTPRHLCCRPILVEQSAFVSSGLSPMPPTVGQSINIGPIFARGNINGQPGSGQAANNNNNNSSSNLNDNLASSILSAFGLAQQPSAASQAPNSQNNSANTATTNTATTANSTNAAAAAPPPPPSSNQQQQQDFDEDAGADSPPSDDISQNRGGGSSSSNNNTNERYRNLIQSIISSAGQPSAEVHFINANISVPLNPNSSGNNNNSAPQQSPLSSNSASANTTQSDATQASVNTSTQPTTSTQTRSTSRPILTSTTLPPTSIRNFRPIPASNFLSSFDRFLPCNSHHIRDDSHAHQQNQQTQTIHIRPPQTQRRTVSLDRNSMRQPPANATLQTIQIPTPLNRGQQDSSSSAASQNSFNHFSGVNNITDDEMNHRFNLFGIQLSLRDLDSLTPNFFNAQRVGLRAHLMGSYFSDSEINDETITTAIRGILGELDRYLERLSGFHHPDYDVRKSIENLIMKSLPFIINLIVEDNSSEFGIRIERSLITFCENVYMILVKCIGIKNTERVLNDIANLIMTGEAARGSLSKFPAYVIQTFLIERRSYDLSEIQEFLIIKRPGAPAPIDREDAPMEVDEENLEDAAMMMNEDAADELETTNNEIQQEDLLSDPLPVIDRSEPWHAQFPSNWLPIITRDIARQRRQIPQPTYSDAYISGMSSKRRKVLLSKKPTTNAQQMLAEDVRSAIQVANKSAPSSSSSTAAAAGASSNSTPAVEEIVASLSSDPNVQNAYRDEVKTSVAQRLKNDADFEPEKYPNSSKYFK